MPDSAQPILFEATSRPQQSLNPLGLRIVVALLVAGFGISGLMFTLLGAWPVLFFSGAELLLVAGLFRMHRVQARRSHERISLADGHLRIIRTDGQGRRHEAALDAYWSRITLEAGHAPRLLVGHRGRQIEIGVYLNEDEKLDLARALTAALARYREPRFDNPQLR